MDGFFIFQYFQFYILQGYLSKIKVICFDVWETLFNTYWFWKTDVIWFLSVYEEFLTLIRVGILGVHFAVRIRYIDTHTCVVSENML